MNSNRILSAESVTAGHADKLCDLIADSILDAVLAEDRFARVSCEVMVTTGMVVVAGQITTKCYIDISSVVRTTIREIGYDDPSLGFDFQSCAVIVMLEEQAADVAAGVDRKGAGDTGVAIGYATDEGARLPVDVDFMPVPQFLANRLTDRLTEVQRSDKLPYLYPDGKSHVVVSYDAAGRPRRLEQVVLAAHHHASIDTAKLRRDLKRLVIKPVLDPTGLLDAKTEIVVNPIGPFIEGGPRGDSGVTGRKTGVDCYGTACPHGGSAFAGKDPTQPDRTGCFGARWAAKHLVAAGLARECIVETSYLIGRAEPFYVQVDTRGTGLLPDDKLAAIVTGHFDMSLAGIIEALDLRRPLYAATAVGGSFGRAGDDRPWESLPLLDTFKALKPRRAAQSRRARR